MRLMDEIETETISVESMQEEFNDLMGLLERLTETGIVKITWHWRLF